MREGACFAVWNSSNRLKPMERKKPRAPGFPLVVEAEIFDPQSGQSTQPTTSALSMGGCYLEGPNPPPIRAAVRRKLIYSESSRSLCGDVVRSQPSEGMAVRFRTLE